MSLAAEAADADLMTPDIIYCGFQRISPVARAQDRRRAMVNGAEQAIELTISLAGPEPYTFTTAIHKQADIQTLARTIEVLLADRRVTVACMFDQATDNVLRWSDTVADVLDRDSVVGVVPLSESTLIRSIQMSDSRPSTPKRPDSAQSWDVRSDRSGPKTAPIPQMEFIQSSARSRSTSFHGSVSPDLDSSRPSSRALIHRKSDLQRSPQKPTSMALRLLRSNGVRRPSDISTAGSGLEDNSYLPPLPMSPMPKITYSPLSIICANAVALLAFCRFCARKKTLCELLFWLDTESPNVDEEYVSRLYLVIDAPLRLNLPREVSTVDEAKDLLRDGLLGWSETRFAGSEEELWSMRFQVDRPALFNSAVISLKSSDQTSRQRFVELMKQALHPEDSSILSLKERKLLDTRQAIFEQVCSQYFPGQQIDTKKYFEYKTSQMTLPERSRLVNRRNVYGGLFDRNVSPATRSQISLRSKEDHAKIESWELSVKPPSVYSPFGAHIGEVMPMEDADLQGWRDVGTKCAADRASSDGLASKSSSLRRRPIVPRLESGGGKTPEIITPPSSARSVRHQRAESRGSSSISDDTQTTPVLTLTETQRADLIRRQAKLRTLLGESPKEAINGQTKNMTSEMIDPRVGGTQSPTPSVGSHFSGTSSRFSLSRAEQAEEVERRTHLRRAAKLYAMFGEHADSPSSIPFYRINGTPRKSFGDQHLRSRSSASQYEPASSRAPSRVGSVSSQSLYSPSLKSPTLPSHEDEHSASLGRSSSRYQPDRRNNARKPFSGPFGIFRNTSSAVTTKALDHADLLSDFPVPPTSAHSSPSPNANSYVSRSYSRASNLYASSLLPDDESILEVDSDEEEDDEEGDAIVQDVRTNMKLRQLLGNDAPTSIMS